MGEGGGGGGGKAADGGGGGGGGGRDSISRVEQASRVVTISNNEVTQVLGTVGESVLNGGISTLIGTATMAFATTVRPCHYRAATVPPPCRHRAAPAAHQQPTLRCSFLGRTHTCPESDCALHPCNARGRSCAISPHPCPCACPCAWPHAPPHARPPTCVRRRSWAPPSTSSSAPSSSACCTASSSSPCCSTSRGRASVAAAEAAARARGAAARHCDIGHCTSVIARVCLSFFLSFCTDREPCVCVCACVSLRGNTVKRPACPATPPHCGPPLMPATP